MSARVLVVDDILANVRLLEAKLESEYFEVFTATDGIEALEKIQRIRPDIVLLDVMMPGMDGIEVCRRIKSNPATRHIPVIMVTALDQPRDRVRGLEAGADDFLTKPVNDIALFSRVKSLVRLKMLIDELIARNSVDNNVLLAEEILTPEEANRPGRILFIDDHEHMAARIRRFVEGHHDIDFISDPLKALKTVEDNDYELLMVNLDMENYDGLRLCSQLRSLERNRQVPILIIIDPDDTQRMARAMEMGVNDYLMRPIDKQELLARINTQIRRWRYTCKLRDSVRNSITMAVTDPLTGLYNRRYMETHGEALVDEAANRGKALSMLLLDLDFFKRVNDQYGHFVGDRVLKELASRLKAQVRRLDIVCRVGGEEFVILLPGADVAIAWRVAERIRRAIAEEKFDVGEKPGELLLDLTASIGIAGFEGPEDTLEKLYMRADEALYRAKEEGRNRVVIREAA